MLQSMAIKLISSKALDSDLVDAIYLSGDLATSDGDNGSEIHLHFIVDENNYNKVLDLKEDFLQAYYSIMYIDTDMNTNITKCIYDNGVIIYLYVNVFSKVSELMNIKIIYDYKDFLKNKSILNKEELEIAQESKLINDFSFNLNCFYQYMRSNNLVKMNISAITLYNLLDNYLKCKYDNEIPSTVTYEYNHLIDNYQYNKSVEFVKKMMVIFDRYMNNITIDLAQKVNIDLYLFAKDKIWNYI